MIGCFFFTQIDNDDEEKEAREGVVANLLVVLSIDSNYALVTAKTAEAASFSAPYSTPRWSRPPS
jgi:hypothetical protein